MPEDLVELRDTPVLRVKAAVRTRADYKGKAPALAFEALESKLPSLKGRRFYGFSRETADGGEEYYACVARIDSDDPEKLELEKGVISGGMYVRRKVMDWQTVVRTGRLPEIISQMIEGHKVDRKRGMVEYYRSQTELHLLLPVLT